VRVRVSTLLDAPPERVWELVKRADTFLYVTRPFLGFTGVDEWPETLEEGEGLEARLLAFGVLPMWRHHLMLVRLDDAAREVYTNEGGGPIRAWNHRITVEPADGRSRYTDEIEIHAGPLTPLIWLYAALFFRYRQMRWRRLVRDH
jgi:ligand-binding SRPBCC domain-containing protein